MLLPEPEESLFTSPLVHCTVNVLRAEASTYTQFMYILYVVLGCTEDNCLLVLLDMFSQNVE